MAEEGGLPTCRLSLVDEEVSKEERQMKDGGSSAFHKIPVIVVISVQFPFSNLNAQAFFSLSLLPSAAAVICFLRLDVRASGSFLASPLSSVSTKWRISMSL